MANWTDLSSAFGYGTQLTSALQQALRDNITAAFEGASGTPGLGANCVGSEQLINGEIGSCHISSGCIGTAHLAIDAVTVDILADNAVIESRIADNAVNSGHIKDNSVGSSQLVNDAVASCHIIGYAIGAGHLSNNCVTNAKLDVDYATASISKDSSGTVTDCILTPVGNYGFYPRFSINSIDTGVDEHIELYANILNANFEDVRSSNMIYTNYCTSIYMSLTCLQQPALEMTFRMIQTYVTASGEVKWIFLKTDKKTGKIISTFEAWDHPSINNNDRIEHPFLNYNVLSHDIILINPTSADLCDQEDMLDKYNIDDIDLLRNSEISIDSQLIFPKVRKDVQLLRGKRRMRALKKKYIKKEYIPEPRNTNIKLAKINFKKQGRKIIY